MFGNELFRNWPVVLLGAGCFSGFYGMIILMSDRLMFGIEGISREVLGIIGLAFVGYVMVAMIIRRDEPE